MVPVVFGTSVTYQNMLFPIILIIEIINAITRHATFKVLIAN